MHFMCLLMYSDSNEAVVVHGEGRTMPLGFCVPRPTFRSVGLASNKPGFPSCIQSGDGLIDKERIEQGKAFIFRE